MNYKRSLANKPPPGLNYSLSQATYTNSPKSNLALLSITLTYKISFNFLFCSAVKEIGNLTL